MARLPDIPDATFTALQHIRETCLIQYNSLFTPERKLWSLENLRQFHALFVERFDQGEGSFLEKWQKQLAGADDDIFQLAAELLYVQQFFTSVTGPEKKLENVRAVLTWCKQPPSIPEWAVEGLTWGLSRDQSFNQHRPFHLAWLNEYLIHWQELPAGERTALLNDPWRFAQDVRAVEFERGAFQPMQEAWLYMVFPDSFENISSRANKQQIRDTFTDRLQSGRSGNVDFDLFEIRKALTDKYGEGFHFYRSPIGEQWQKAKPAQQDAEERVRDQITRQDILDAIAALDRDEPHTFGPSTFYDLLEGGRRYPPKAVVGLAARRALGRPLRPDEFSGGQESWGFRLLRERGFTIVDKERPSGGHELPSVPPLQVWIEDTKTTVHGHGGPGWEFGSCLWSPSAYATGSDNYALMREPKIDDLVIHINNGDLVGWSYVSSPFRELTDGPPSPGQWAGRPSYYRVDLKGYQEFPRSIPLRDFIEKNYAAIEEELRNDAPKRYPFILYGGKEIRHAQGAYLTRCTPKLYALIRSTVFGDAPARRANARYWAMALGEGGRLWDECQEKGIAAIGWDEFELGDLTKYPDRESIQQILIEKRGEPGPTPSNDALCLFQFSHEMAPGDYIVAKVGRRRLLGIGIITSEYFLDQKRTEYQHCRRVKWLSSRGVELPENLALGTKTLTDVTAYQDLVTFTRDHYFESHVTPPSPSAAPYGIEQAMEALFMPQSLLESILAALRRKKNVILQGPPGVGKTFAGRYIAFALLGELDHTRVEMVQFHQSYAYEDFVQGWRPKLEGGFRLKDGVFVEFCNRARIDPGRAYVFIIDEINRGNLSKILGELMMLIEADKRGAKNAIPLTYSESDGERFSVPENVHLLGLMNTADRSLAMVDYALRRRFVFFSLAPALESEKFAAQLNKAGGSAALVEKIRRCVGALNKQIAADSDLGDGFLVGHSFFCPGVDDAPIDDSWYQAIVDTELAPLVREYWFDKKQTEVDDIIRQLREAT